MREVHSVSDWFAVARNTGLSIVTARRFAEQAIQVHGNVTPLVEARAFFRAWLMGEIAELRKAQESQGWGRDND